MTLSHQAHAQQRIRNLPVPGDDGMLIGQDRLLACGRMSWFWAGLDGVSALSVNGLVKALGMSCVSSRHVNPACAKLDERVGAFLNRQIEADWPNLWILSTYPKSR